MLFYVQAQVFSVTLYNVFFKGSYAPQTIYH